MTAASHVWNGIKLRACTILRFHAYICIGTVDCGFETVCICQENTITPPFHLSMSALCMKELPEPCFRFRHGEQIRWQSQCNLGKCWYLSFFSKHNGQYITTEISFDKSIYWISRQAFNNLTILLEIFIEILNKIRRSHNFFFSCVTGEFKIFLNHWVTIWYWLCLFVLG